MKLKLVLSIVITLITIADNAQVILTNAFYNVGTNGFDLFCMTALNTDANTVYSWETTTNLASTNWCYVDSPFVGLGTNSSNFFWTVIPQGNRDRFYRMVMIAQFLPESSRSYITNSYGNDDGFEVTNWPSLPIP